MNGVLGVVMLAITGAVQATEFTVTVTGVDVARGGSVMVFVFSEEGFPKKHEKALLVQKSNALDETMRFTVTVQTEALAVKVLHDENGDGKVSKNWTGVYPKEGLGFSNDQRLGMFGPPGYNSAKVSREVFANGLGIRVIYP
ncbi:MAG: DUF2141 domain-containing protein [Candidatus Thiodiazotropha sp. (ex Monitilora ramsayi)]|nr:DUF2141 domain-containing protein [Candidatus Thiodiazotropha sp. (ex Monitilora ramsayi)]